MSQTIDPIKLKAAAEHLEWVLKQYPDSEDVQGLLRALSPLIQSAIAGQISEPMNYTDVPGLYGFSEGRYTLYEDPNVENAYARFSTELKGGLTEQEKRINERINTISSGAVP